CSRPKRLAWSPARSPEARFQPARLSLAPARPQSGPHNATTAAIAQLAAHMPSHAAVNRTCLRLPGHGGFESPGTPETDLVSAASPARAGSSIGATLFITDLRGRNRRQETGAAHDGQPWYQPWYQPCAVPAPGGDPDTPVRSRPATSTPSNGRDVPSRWAPSV